MKRPMLVYLVVFGLSVAFAASAVEEKNVLLYWSFDNVSGKTVKDDSGNGHDGEMVDNAKIVKGQFGKAVQLANGIVQLLDEDVISPVGDSGEISLEAWMMLNDHQQYDGIISIEAQGGDCCEFRMMVNPGFNPFWNMGHHTDRSLASFTFDMGKWYHYVITGDGKDGKVYVNGEFIGEVQENFDLEKFDTVSIYVGAGENPNVWRVEDAIIDEVAIYDKALTLDEVKESMELSIPGVLSVEPRGKLALQWASLKAGR